MKRPHVDGIPQVVLSLKALIKSGNSYLLIKRSSKLDYAPGSWDLPGGKLGIGEDINKTLTREVKEETNLTVKPENMNFYLEKHKSEVKKHEGIMYVQLAFKSQFIKGKLKLSEEHSDFKWLPLKQALKLNLSPETKRSLLSLTRKKR